MYSLTNGGTARQGRATSACQRGGFPTLRRPTTHGITSNALSCGSIRNVGSFAPAGRSDRCEGGVSRHVAAQAGSDAAGDAEPSSPAPAARKREKKTEAGSEFDVDTPVSPSGRDESLGPRDDDALPDSLPNALNQAAAATADAIARSNNRCQVELLLTEFWDPISGAGRATMHG